MSFVCVDGPFRRAEKAGKSILDLFAKDVESGEALLADLVSETRAEIVGSSETILYVLAGPEPAKATPMQYGGLFLEKDRELLTFAKEKGEVWVYVEAGPGAYLDFVSDLPADVFAWDARETGFSVGEMRELRTGKLCSNDPDADLPLEALNGKEAAGIG